MKAEADLHIDFTHVQTGFLRRRANIKCLAKIFNNKKSDPMPIRESNQGRRRDILASDSFG